MAEGVGRSAQAEFRKRVKAEFGYTVKIKTYGFHDLARKSATFATVTDSDKPIEANEWLQARVLAREFGIILDRVMIRYDPIGGDGGDET